jgi:hypothetical protein
VNHVNQSEPVEDILRGGRRSLPQARVGGKLSVLNLHKRGVQLVVGGGGW